MVAHGMLLLVAVPAGGGHLHILKWARANGCPWNEVTCENAAQGGHLDVLKWARENGCPWDSNAIEKAVAFGRLETFEWCRKNGCVLDLLPCLNIAMGREQENMLAHLAALYPQGVSYIEKYYNKKFNLYVTVSISLMPIWQTYFWRGMGIALVLQVTESKL
jgi:hypothetical protein